MKKLFAIAFLMIAGHCAHAEVAVVDENGQLLGVTDDNGNPIVVEDMVE